MSASWVAGAVRARALARRRLGAAGARVVATSATFAEALASLAQTSYGHDVRVGQGLAEAQHGVAASLLWNMRVLAGWLPRGSTELVRVLAAGFEVANVDEHLARLQGEPAEPPYALGTLDTAWSRVADTTSLEGVGEVLGTSSWRVHGGTTRHELHLGLRLAWADAVVGALPEAADWARGAAALLVLREVSLEGRPLSDPVARQAAYVLGPAFVDAVSGPDIDPVAAAGRLPGGVRWALGGVRGPQDVWRAEAAWWLRVERDGFALLRVSAYDRRPVVGALAVLAVDAWRVRAALESAARGGAGPVLEAFDALA